MVPKLTVLLIEDDPTTCDEMASCMEIQDNIKLIGITNNSPDALSLVKYHIPDVVVLNLELHHGSGNGIHFLNELNGLSLPFKPYILVTTRNSSDTTYEIARHLGADFIMYKQNPCYSTAYVIQFLQTISSFLLSSRYSSLPDFSQTDATKIQNQRILQWIYKELDLVGINRKNIGFSYLADAILLTSEQPACNIFTRIANKYHKSDDSVEHAMRHAINRAWLTSPLEEIEKNYTAKIHSNRGAPTTLEFVYYYADKVKKAL